MRRSKLIPVEDVHVHRRTLLKAGAAAAALLLPSAPNAQAVASISATLTARDPNASPNAQSLYAQLVALENLARAGASPMTIMGQHIEGQNELYNPDYGDTGGTTYVGYYYNKVYAITGRLPGFVEIDFGPGYNSTNGWGIFNNRTYDDTRGLPSDQPQWQYGDDVADLAFAVWKGFPRSNDGTYQYDGTVPNVDGSYSEGFVGGASAGNANGGSAAGIVGCSFHQPYPGSSTKDFSTVEISMSQTWFDSVVDWSDNTPEYLALLSDLQFLADKLSYFAAWDVPVLFRPYHEMNDSWAWWGAKTPYSYQQLWQIMYNYLVNTRGLHNLIFVWAPKYWTPGAIPGDMSGDIPEPWDYYPGAGYVDIVAVDDYNAPGSAPENADFTNIYYTALVNYNKPRMLAESGYVPITSSGDNALTASPWVIWSVWGDYLTNEAYNSDADVQSTYYAINQVYTGGSGTGFGQNFDWGSIHAD
jgi:mannan endo-1,4-beta-mannosidase